MKNIVEIGKKFNKLTVISDNGVVNGQRNVECICDCGSIVKCNFYRIRNGHKKSCGCINKAFTANKIINGYKSGNASIHKMTNTRVYRIWKNMKERCRNKNKSNYKYYGGRGIDVCDRWKNSFQLFFNDMGYPPTDKHSIDRINVNGNYEPSNCKWSTQSEQCKNKRPIEKK